MKIIKPTTPAKRGTKLVDFRELIKKKPEKSLTKGKSSKAGRLKGKVTTRHKGGGHKKKYRQVDFKRKKTDIPAKVVSLEYDPNRSAHIALIVFKDGQKNYVLAPRGMKVGDEIICSNKAPVKIGNRMELKNIPEGTEVFNVELIPGKGGQIIRSAGSSAQVTAHEDGFVHLVLPSGEIRMIPERAMATIGQVSNPEHGAQKLGKAGRARWLGQRPTVRGSAMSPRDHPHGGGEGRQPIGMHPKTPWGKPALGAKTRKKKKKSNKYIIRRRKKRKK